MKLYIKYFGMVAEGIGMNEELVEFALPHLIARELREILTKTHPELNIMSYKIAVNQTIADDSCYIKEGDEIAFLPPFAGG